MSCGLIQRWTALARELGLVDSCDVGQELLVRYGERHRYFHGPAHLTQVLDTLDEPDADPRLKLAAWFHDAVYRPGRGDNEKRSAELARKSLTQCGLTNIDLDFVARAVIATEGHTDPDPSFAPLLDADLSVLGAGPEKYQGYRDAIRREYSIVPRCIFRPARARFLRAMLEREAIYQTRWFRLHYEVQARANLGSELNALSGNG